MQHDSLQSMAGVNHQSKIIFAHVPKTGGISIMNALGMKGTHVSLADTKVILGAELFSEYYKFSIIRNPYDRLRSYFNYLLTVRKAQLVDGRRYYGWMGGTHDLSNFRCFYTKLYALYLKTGFVRSHFAPHSFPQTNWILDGEDIIADDIISFDEIESIPKLIKKRTSVNIKNIPHMNKNIPCPGWDNMNDCGEYRHVIEQMYPDDIILYNKLKEQPSKFLNIHNK